MFLISLRGRVAWLQNYKMGHETRVEIISINFLGHAGP